MASGNMTGKAPPVGGALPAFERFCRIFVVLFEVPLFPHKLKNSQSLAALGV